MREFFHGWRRKVGCVTLLMAGFVCGAWCRSLIVTDIFNVDGFGDHYYVQSGHGVVAWIRQRYRCADDVFACGHGTIEHTDSRYKYSKWGEPWQPVEHWRCCWQYGIGYAAIGCHEQVGGGVRTIWCRAPYWECAIPLTLLSAYLLLWKPRKRTGAKHA